VAKSSQPTDLVQPGHIFPLQAVDGGVLMRAGHTEAGCDLAAMAGCNPSSVICEIMNDDGTMARLPDLQLFAAEHGLKIGTIADLIEHRSRNRILVSKSAAALCKPRTAFSSPCVSRPIQPMCTWPWSKANGTPTPVAWPVSTSRCRCSTPSRLGRTMHSWSLDAALHIIAQGCGVVVLLNCGESAPIAGPI
jgi:3,4-dihydroxy 2-butanone 4-phosphate synthase / GTP cyclohydrolase II